MPRRRIELDGMFFYNRPLTLHDLAAEPRSFAPTQVTWITETSILKSNGLSASVARPVRGLQHGHRLESVVHGCRRFLPGIIDPTHNACHGADKGVRKPTPLKANGLPLGRLRITQDAELHLVGLTFRVIHQQAHLGDDSSFCRFPFDKALLVAEPKYVPVVRANARPNRIVIIQDEG